MRISCDGRKEFRNSPYVCSFINPLTLLYVTFAPGQILRVPGIHQVHFETRLFENVVCGDPIDSGGLHGDGSYPALLQPIGHRLQLRRGAPAAPDRLGISARRYRHVVRFVADINPCGIGMEHFQGEVFALDLPHRLPPLLTVHLVPMMLRWMVGCSFVFLLWLGFHANVSLVRSTWLGPVGENYLISPAGSGRSPFQDKPATIFTIANHRSHALHRAGTLQSQCGLSCRAVLRLGF